MRNPDVKHWNHTLSLVLVFRMPSRQVCWVQMQTSKHIAQARVTHSLWKFVSTHMIAEEFAVSSSIVAATEHLHDIITKQATITPCFPIFRRIISNGFAYALGRGWYHHILFGDNIRIVWYSVDIFVRETDEGGEHDFFSNAFYPRKILFTESNIYETRNNLHFCRRQLCGVLRCSF